MKILVYSTHSYDEPFLLTALGKMHELVLSEEKLSMQTVRLSKGFDAVALFSSDLANEEVLKELKKNKVKYITLRSVGYDHVDIKVSSALGIKVANVPEYSPHAIAEHAVAMLLAVNRKILQSQLLMQLQDFRLDMLMGLDVHGKTVGVIGTGKNRNGLRKNHARLWHKVDCFRSCREQCSSTLADRVYAIGGTSNSGRYHFYSLSVDGSDAQINFKRTV